MKWVSNREQKKFSLSNKERVSYWVSNKKFSLSPTAEDGGAPARGGAVVGRSEAGEAEARYRLLGCVGRPREI